MNRSLYLKENEDPHPTAFGFSGKANVSSGLGWRRVNKLLRLEVTV